MTHNFSDVIVDAPPTTTTSLNALPPREHTETRASAQRRRPHRRGFNERAGFLALVGRANWFMVRFASAEQHEPRAGAAALSATVSPDMGSQSARVAGADGAATPWQRRQNSKK